MSTDPTAPATADVTGSARNIVRVAVVQLGYHPAIHGFLADPLGKGDPEGKLPLSTLPSGFAAAPDALRPAHRALSDRVEAAYLHQLVRKLRSVLLACRGWQVQIIVFPEYSIPATALEPIAEAAGDMVVVAGSCFVDTAVRKSSVYERLSAPVRPGGGQNVVPVLHRSTILGLVAKLHATDREQKLGMKPASTWTPVPLPAELGGSLGVLTCLDFLERTSPLYCGLVAPRLDQCRLLAVPALTSEGSLPLFQGHQIEESGPGRRPILFANDASEGGSTIVAGQRTFEEAHSFPLHAGVLGKNEEGVLVADLDLAVVGVGKGGRYGESLPCKPFAAASLVYSGTTPALAAWLTRLDEVLPETPEDEDEDEDEALDRAVAWLAENPPPRGHATPMQGRRWDRMLQGVEHETSLERLRRLTREIVLPAEVLPLDSVQTALASGAGKAIHAWVLGGHEGAAPFATVAAKLSEQARAGEARRSVWAHAARHAWAEIADAVNGVTGQPPQSILSTPLDRATETVENHVVKMALDEGNAHASAGRYQEARAAFERALAEAQRQGEANDVHGDKWRLWAARAAIGAATSAVNLQDLGGARRLLETLPMDALDPGRRVRVANLWAALGDVEQARASLPSEALLSENEARELRDVHQRIALAEGHIPSSEELSTTPDILLLAATVLLERHDAARAAQLARRVLASQTENALIHAEALHALIWAVLYTTDESFPSLVGIPEPERAGTVGAIESSITRLLEAPIPEPRRRRLLGAWRMLLELTYDTDALMVLSEIPAEEAREKEADSALRAAIRTAKRLAQEDHLEAALQMLPPDDHPWRRRLAQIDILKAARQDDRALAEALALAGELPGRARIEMTASALLSQHGRHAEALAHARRAWEALPARGLRLGVAELLLALRRGEDAWNTIAGDERSAGPRILRALAIAADQAHPERALDLWRAYVARRPGDVAAKVHVAQILIVQNRLDDAAREAWATFEAHADILSVEQLHSLGALQGAPLPEVERRRRAQAIAATLQRRFPADPDAEHARLSLLAESGELERSAERIDFALLREAGFARTMTTAQVLDMMRAQGQVTALVQAFGKRGGLPFALFCGAVTPPVPVPLVVVRLFHREHADVPFSSPVELQDVPAGLRLDEAALLVSEVELYILGTLGLLETLQARLGSGGRVHLFRGAWMHVVEDHGLLRAQAEAQRLKKLDETVAALARLPRLTPALDETGLSDVQLAVKRGAMVLSSAPDKGLHAHGIVGDIPEGKRISPRTVLQWLAEQGGISTTSVSALSPYFELDQETGRPEPVPGMVLVSAFFLGMLHEHKALTPFLALFPGAHVGDRDWKDLLARQSAAVEDRQAAELAAHVHAWIAEGMRSGLVQIVPDPEIQGLPALLDPEDETGKRLVAEPMEWAVSYADTLAAHPSWWRLTADFFGSTAPLSAETAPLVAWTDREVEGRALVKRLRAGRERHLSLPILLRALLGSPAEEARRHQALWKLAELGAADALGGAEILALFREYSGLEGATPKRILDRLEWMAREPGHLGGDTARLRLASAYAAAVFRAFCGQPSSTLEGSSEASKISPDAELPPAQAEALGRTLLGRAETLALDTRTDFLDAVIRFLAASAASAPSLAWERDPDRRGFTRRIDGPLPALWDFVQAWAGMDGSRRAAYERGVREIWLVLDGENESRLRVMGAALDHAVEGRHSLGELRFTNLAVEAEAILSSLWSWRPTSIRGIDLSGPGLSQQTTVFDEEVLASGAQQGTHVDMDPDGRFVTFAFPVPGTQFGLRVFAPAEAILLRQTPGESVQLANHLKVAQGIHDGRAYRLLEGFERHPSRKSTRRAVARRAVSALWRAVRDDPSYLVRWPRSRGISSRGARPSLHELRALLSEPQVLGPVDTHLGKLVLRRLQDERGIWRSREDAPHLLKMAFELPGDLMVGPVRSMLDSQYEAHVEEALAIVEQSENQPIARVARSILLLRAGAARKPLLKLPSGESMDLQEKLPDVLRHALERSMAEPRPDTFAAAEPALLRVCMQVVLDLARHEPLPIREGVWLTYRLFQWLCAQLDAISPDARSAALRDLVALAPPPGKPLDRLDPRGFGRDLFDHRLATVLYALGTMQEPALLFEKSPDSATKVPSRLAWQPAMVDRLVELASRLDESPGLRSEVGWSMPDTIGDLALVALLRMEPNAFGRVPEQARLARLRRLPENPDSMDPGTEALFLPVVAAAAIHTASLSEAERRVLVSHIRRLPTGKAASRWRMQVFPSCFANSNTDVTEAEATLALQERLDDPLAPMALAFLLFGVAARDDTRLRIVLDDILQEAERRHIDPVPLAAGVGRVAILVQEPVRTTLTDLLRALATRPPFQGDDRMRELMVALESR